MAKTLSCWFGRHSWITRVTQGETYKVCSACGKMPRRNKGADLDARAHDHYPGMYDNP